jgi:hypothetical protein
MKKIIVCICVLCIYCITNGQNVGDYRTCLEGEYTWDNISVWQQFNGTTWISALDYPGKNTSALTVTICNNASVICNKPIEEFSIQNLIIDSTSILTITSKNIKIEQDLCVWGTLSIQSNIGTVACNTIHLYGTIIQDYSKLFTIASDAYIYGFVLQGNGTTQLTIHKNLYFQNKPCKISQLGLYVLGKTYIQTSVEFNSIAGDKTFIDTLFITNCTVHISIGETYTCNSSVVIQNATIQTVAFPFITIRNNLILDNAYCTRHDDYFGTFAVQGNIEIPSNTESTIESACIELQGNCNIRGTLNITDKKGVKTIYGSFTVFTAGMFKNSGNDRIRIWGNLENYGTCNNGTNGVFQLLGKNKHISGTLKTPRLLIDGLYYNNNTLEVISDFGGNGTLIQTNYANLSIQSPSSPTIIADAYGNIVSYTRGGNQDVRCSKFYILKAACNKNSLLLQQHIESIYQIQFTKPCFINCNGYTITFESISDTTILGIDNFDRGFILMSGSIIINQIPFQKNVFIPLFTSSRIEACAGIRIQELDSLNNSFTIHALEKQVLEFPGMHSSNLLYSGIVNTTYHIQSASTQASISLYWHSSSEMPAFNRNFCSIMHHNGTQWHALSDYNEAQQITTNIYAIQATTSAFSPFAITSNAFFLNIHTIEYTVLQNSQNIVIQGNIHKSFDLEHIQIYSSTNGIQFTQLAEIDVLNQQSFAYYDYTHYLSDYIYYKCVGIYNDKSIIEYSIISIANKHNSLITIQKTADYLLIEYPHTIPVTLYTPQLQAIGKFYTNQKFTTTVSHGLYFLYCNKTYIPIVITQ